MDEGWVYSETLTRNELWRDIAVAYVCGHDDHMGPEALARRAAECANEALCLYDEAFEEEAPNASVGP